MNTTTILANRSNYGSARSLSSIKYIVIHYTGNDGDTDTANANYFRNNSNLSASAHYFVDDDSVTQSVNDNYVAWSVGGAKWNDCGRTGGGRFYGMACNSNSISIEMCDTVRDGSCGVSPATLNNVFALATSLMKKYGIDIDHVIRHFDVNGKYCPEYYMNSSAWNTFKKGLASYNGQSYTPPSSSPSSPSGDYSMRQFVSDVQGAIGVTVDGFGGPNTLRNVPTVSQYTNRKHAVVLFVQKRLNALGYNCGAADGIAGGQFDSAVRRFQSYYLGFEDGVLTSGNKTWAKMIGTTVQASSGYELRAFVKDIQRTVGTTVDGFGGPNTLNSVPTVSQSNNRRHPVVLFVQKRLNYLGYNCGAADGIAGGQFDSAVRRFQSYYLGFEDGVLTSGNKTWAKLLGTTVQSGSSGSSYGSRAFTRDIQGAIGVTADGIVGPNTLSNTPTISKSTNRRHAVVKYVQKRLNSLGYNCGAADGITGNQFDSAVRRFQSHYLGFEDGVLTSGNKTWAKLFSC